MTQPSNPNKPNLSKRGFVVLALGIAVAILLIQQYFSKPNLAPPVEVYASTVPFFNASVIDLTNTEQPLKQWQGQLLVVNFWATWCAPCREEMPELAELAEEYAGKLAVLGISLDNAAKMQAFAQQSSMPYPLLAADMEGMALSNSLGNVQGVVPHTVIIGSDGKIISAYFGRVSKALLLETLQPILATSS
ncbi:TlpA family protein disulfide reductase [Methylobacillus arboreus]|uniref:TlpA family protein disulfide reductase n=1 Tax=Methylobacillus arboreus TaxID=755170 RepID=UPI001E45E26F|nr:TlpA disulfide reductase family protein [Methylobacillus arboreus]MCB5191016.1 TlpA family protein disulfide reductase [Methylobacillus arboreus]